jgi:hypothetical protein
MIVPCIIIELAATGLQTLKYYFGDRLAKYYFGARA